MHFAYYVYSENSVVNNLKQVRSPDFYFNLNSKYFYFRNAAVKTPELRIKKSSGFGIIHTQPNVSVL